MLQLLNAVCCVILPLAVFSSRPDLNYSEKHTPMKIFLGKIDALLTEEELKPYLAQYGELDELRLLKEKGYGFAYMPESSGVDRLLNAHEHCIGGKSFIVERGRTQNDRRNDGRFDDRYGNGPRRGYGYETDSQYGRSEYQSRQGYGRRGCDYCDACPIHGRPNRNDRNDQFKLVIEQIGEEVHESDVEKFIRDYGLSPSFVRVKDRCAFVEFNSVSEKDEALKKLDGMSLQLKREDGSVEREYVVATRSFVNFESRRREYGFKRRRTDRDGYDGERRSENRPEDVYRDSDDGTARRADDANGTN